MNKVKEKTVAATLEDKRFISLLPFYTIPTTLLVGNKLPCHKAKIASLPTERLLKILKRHAWVEGLYVRKKDLNKIKRYKNPDGSYKNNFIDPAKKGGILDLINHAPEEAELINFKFKNSTIKENVAIANLNSTIKFYNGYAIMGLEAFKDIDGGEYGKQLLWSYAQSCEYLAYNQYTSNNKTILLFDNRPEHQGEIIDPRHYTLREINIFIDTGEYLLIKVASLTRWELMESTAETELMFSTEDPYSSIQSDAIRSPITYGFLQAYLKQNPLADRIIIKIPSLES